MRHRFLICHPLPGPIAAAAVHVVTVLSGMRLRTLDALHLAIAREIPAGVLVSADRTMLNAAREVGFAVVSFARAGA